MHAVFFFFDLFMTSLGYRASDITLVTVSRSRADLPPFNIKNVHRPHKEALEHPENLQRPTKAQNKKKKKEEKPDIFYMIFYSLIHTSPVVEKSFPSHNRYRDKRLHTWALGKKQASTPSVLCPLWCTEKHS